MRKLTLLKQLFFACVLILPLLWKVGNVQAGVDSTLTFYSLTYDGNADNRAAGQPISDWGWHAQVWQTEMCYYTNAQGQEEEKLATAFIVPEQPSSGLTTVIDGITYTVFETGTPGIGWVLGISYAVSGNNFTPLMLGETQWYPAAGTPTAAQFRIGGYVKVTLVKTEKHLTTGSTTLNPRVLAKIVCKDANGAVLENSYIRIGTAATMDVRVKGCEVQSSGAEVVNFNTLNSSDFHNVGSVSAAQDRTIRLKCDQGIHLMATVSDQSNLSNRSNIVSLTGSSTASGLGIQVFYNNGAEPLLLGPDSSGPGTQGQFQVVTNTTQNQVINFPLMFRYIRTGDISAGTANGLIGVTFSYQ